MMSFYLVEFCTIFTVLKNIRHNEFISSDDIIFFKAENIQKAPSKLCTEACIYPDSRISFSGEDSKSSTLLIEGFESANIERVNFSANN